MAVTESPGGAKKRKAKENDETGPATKRGKKAVTKAIDTEEEGDTEQGQAKIKPDQQPDA